MPPRSVDRMRSTLLFLVGAGVGYVFGTRAGRQRYEQLKSAAKNAWEDPRVQKAMNDTADYVRQKAPVVGARVAEGAQDVAGRVADTAKDMSEKVQRTADDVRGRISHRSEDARDRAIVAAAEFREEALEDFDDEFDDRPDDVDDRP